jgi:putative membrane protein
VKLSIFLLPVILFLSTLSLDRLTSLHTKVLSRAEQKFLINIADARMGNWQEGKMALEHGSAEAVKQYGAQMMKDQEQLMAELKQLAASKNFVLPESVSKDKSRWLRDLKTENGKEFDEKFIKMMVIDHRKDVKNFRMAAQFNDPAIRAFASRYLPLIEAHLSTVSALH